MLEPAVLTATLEAVSDAVLIAGPDGAICWVNAAFTALTGYTRDEVAGKTPRLFKSGVHDAAFYGELWSTVLSGRVWTGEMTNLRKDGSVYVERQTITPVKDAGGAITHFVAVKRDVTGERGRWREEREAILQTALDGFVMVDGAGRILETNDAYCRLSGYTRDELLRMRIHDVEAAETPEAIDAHRARIAARGFDRFETRHRRKDGAIVDLDICLNHIPATGQYFAFLRDITEHKRTERALRESEANYRNLFEQMPEGCAVHETAGAGEAAEYRFLAVNPAFERLIGLSAEAVAGRSLREALPELEREWTEVYQAVAVTGKPVHFARYSPALGKHIEGIAWRADGRRFATVLADVTEQRETAARLEESEARYRVLVETALEGVWQIDAEHRTTFVNRRLAEMVGYTREELMGKPVTFLVEEDVAHLAIAALERIRAGQAVPLDCRLRHKDGSRFWVLLSPTPWYDAAGRYTGAMAMVADINERREAERELQFERAQLLSIFDAIEDPVYVCDPRTHEVLFVNRSLRAALGRDPIGGKCYRELQGKSEPCDFCTNPIIFANGPKSHRWRFHNAFLDRTYDVTDQVIRWPDGRDVRLEFASDVTEGVTAEERLRDAHRLLDTLVQAAPVAIVALDAERRVRMWNRTAEQLTGWSAEELLGRPLPVLRERDAAVTRVLAGETIPALEYQTRHRDGSRLDLRVSAAPLRDAAGGIGGLVGIAIDMSDRKRLEAQLLQAQKLEGVGRLAGGVAHDFNNLLTIINGHADLVMMQIEDRQNPLYENAAEIKSAGERAAGLTRQLLAFSRKQVMQPCLLDLNGVVSEVQRMLCRLIGEDIEVVTTLAQDLGRVKADPGLLHQALINLAVNARDAMPEGGRLTIETGEMELPAGEGGLDAGRYVTLTVTDTGTGMDDNTKAHLFEPFFTTKPAGRGTGLGLSTVYGVVKQSSGHIFVESETGKGSSFRICLPWAAAPEVARPRAPAGAGADSSGNETVLVVEDQAEVRRLVSSALGSFGYRMLEAGSGTDALALAERHAGPIHLLLADVIMPGLSGKEVAQKMAALRPETKVLFMSGYAEDVIAHHGALEPGVAYIAKPFTPEALAAKVRVVLGPRESPRRILVVDDDAGVRTLLCAILRNAGFAVADAVDGRQALAAVESFKPHTVLMDLVMPEQEGIETIRELSQRHPELKIVAMSGAFAGPLLEGTIYLGAHATLAKPITTAALLETIRGLE